MVRSAGAATRWSPDRAGPLLELRDVTTHFRTPRGIVRAVDGVSLSLERGRTLGIVGESGCGKSVLSRSILGLLPRRTLAQAGGQILFEGRDLRAMSEEELRSVRGPGIAMIFQDPMTALNPVMKIGAQIAEPLRYHFGLSKRVARNQAIELLGQVGIPSPHRRVDEYPGQLSGGMRQRVMIAIALSCEPKLLIADEPTTALDVTVQAQILDLLQSLQAERDMAMILITHDLSVVGSRADDIAVMYAGKIVEYAPARALFAAPRMPYTEALLRSSPRLEDPSHTRLKAIAGRPPDLVDPPPGCRFHPRCERAGRRCREEEPALVPDVELDHTYRCWYPVGGPTGAEAEGVASAVTAVAASPDAVRHRERAGLGRDPGARTPGGAVGEPAAGSAGATEGAG
jgi:peptide/nickel transport system ATP-binding protein